MIGLLEGKEKPNEYIVISAHYDHIGINNDLEGDNIFNGANDNASGTTAVLSLAKHYKELDSNSLASVHRPSINLNLQGL